MARAPRRTLLDLLDSKEMVVVCGSGGTGKTTVAAALGAQATVSLGGRVLVLTVDPARRLATALGLGRWATRRCGCRPRRSVSRRSSRVANGASCGWRCSTRKPAGTT